jgi:hypothetical protein
MKVANKLRLVAIIMATKLVLDENPRIEVANCVEASASSEENNWMHCVIINIKTVADCTVSAAVDTSFRR